MEILPIQIVLGRGRVEGMRWLSEVSLYIQGRAISICRNFAWKLMIIGNWQSKPIYIALPEWNSFHVRTLLQEIITSQNQHQHNTKTRHVSASEHFKQSSIFNEFNTYSNTYSESAHSLRHTETQSDTYMEPNNILSHLSGRVPSIMCWSFYKEGNTFKSGNRKQFSFQLWANALVTINSWKRNWSKINNGYTFYIKKSSLWELPVMCERM